MNLNEIETIKYESNQIKDFKKHIDLEGNERILFSGSFGSGKSTFLNEFEKTYNNNYKFIKLYPVNYSVSNNEDIFELIKFDILFELISKHRTDIDLKKSDFDFWLKAAMFMQNKLEIIPVLLSIISLHDKIGKPVATFIEELQKIKINFDEYSKDVSQNESETIFAFLDSFKNRKGNVYEMDATSQFIFDLISRLKANENKIEDKLSFKSVLIIDDLDRLDPDHIFRLFNIFSAHTHSITGENKFGFDKVIFVCDIKNIKKIYFHKYGEGVDFRGYIDKFYSTSPFVFDFNKEVGNNIDLILKDLKYINISPDINFIKRFKYSLSGLIKIFIHENLLNLRDLINVRKEGTIEVIINDNRRVLTILRILFNLLIKICGTEEEFNERMLKLNYRYSEITLHNQISSLELHNLSDNEYLNLLDNLLLYPLFTNSYENEDLEGNKKIDFTNFSIEYKTFFDHKNRIYISTFNCIKKLIGEEMEIYNRRILLPFLIFKNYEKMKELNWI